MSDVIKQQIRDFVLASQEDDMDKANTILKNVVDAKLQDRYDAARTSLGESWEKSKKDLRDKSKKKDIKNSYCGCVDTGSADCGCGGE